MKSCKTIGILGQLGCALGLLLASSATGQDWQTRGIENHQRFSNVQTLWIQGDRLECNTRKSSPLPLERWMQWWDAWPAGLEEIDRDHLESLIGESGLLDSFLYKVESFVGPDRGRAVYKMPWIEGIEGGEITENSHLTVEHEDSGSSSHVVSIQMPYWGGPGNWSKPIIGKAPWIMRLFDPTKPEMIRTGRVVPTVNADAEVRYVDMTLDEGGENHFAFTVNKLHGVFSRYEAGDSFLMLAADIRTLDNGCALPFRMIQFDLERNDSQTFVRKAELMVLRSCVVNADLNERLLHPVGPRQYIRVSELKIKGGPSFFLDDGTPDALAFVEGKMVQPQLRETKGSPWQAAAVVLAILVVLFPLWWFYRRRKVTNANS